MNLSHRFDVLTRTIILVVLLIGLYATRSTQAAPLIQSAEDIIRETLEDANRALGGNFYWRDQSPFAMDSPPLEVGTTSYGEAVFLNESVFITPGDFDATCSSQGGYSQPTSFHGMPACLNRKPHYQNKGYPIGLWWQPYGGLEFNGMPITLGVTSGLDPTCAGYDADTEASCGNWTGVTKPIQLAEALHQAAINNGLYEPMPQEILPVDPGEVVPGQPEAPTDQFVPTDTNESGEIPWPIILGSLGIPVTGALAGAIVSAILAGRSLAEKASAGAEVASRFGNQLQTGANLNILNTDLERINQELVKKNIYVRNPYQGDPTLIAYGLRALTSLAWDNTAGFVTGTQGLTCEGYVNETQERIVEIVSKRFPGAKVENMIFEENSTVKDKKTWGDWFDSTIDDNHNLTKITLLDGSEWAVDFHQKNAGKAPLMRPWSEARTEWQAYLGKHEFKERVRRTFQTDPKRPK